MAAPASNTPLVRSGAGAPIWLAGRQTNVAARHDMSTSLVATVVGRDRPGIVNELSDVARRFGANWAGSRMASLAGQFAGMVHFEVAPDKAEPLAAALRGLESSGLRVGI